MISFILHIIEKNFTILTGSFSSVPSPASENNIKKHKDCVIAPSLQKVFVRTLHKDEAGTISKCPMVSKSA